MFIYPFRIVVIENPNRDILEIMDTTTYKKVKSCIKRICQEFEYDDVEIEVYALYSGEYKQFKLYKDFSCTCETMSSLLGKTKPHTVSIFTNSKEKALAQAKEYCEKYLKFTPTCISCE